MKNKTYPAPALAAPVTEAIVAPVPAAPVPAAPVSVINNNNNNINQYINAQNTLYNFIASQDTITKLQHLLEYKNKDKIDFETKVEDFYRSDVKRLQENRYKHAPSFETSDYLEMIRKISIACKPDLEDFSNFYEDNQVFILYNQWEQELKESGIRTIIDILVTYYLAYYEAFLIRRLNTLNDPRLRESLETYYRFIATVGITPFVLGKSDNQVLYNEDDERYDEDVNNADIEGHRIVDRYTTLYNTMKESITDASRRLLMKSIVDVLKLTTKKNNQALDRNCVTIVNNGNHDFMRLLANQETTESDE